MDQLLVQIHKFLDDCDSEPNSLSDTWNKTLGLKGSRYSLEQLHDMRRPGSDVSLQIVSFHQFTDQHALDLSDPIQRQIIGMGDTKIGNPLLDLDISGVQISSHYVNSIVVASKIIAYLDSLGISEPTVLEVGSGIGLLGVALKQFYRQRLTLILADLPETLEHQSFLILSTFPNEEFTFKPKEAHVRPITGGINFVNAYKLSSQNYPIDVFINCNSMAEMKAETANGYIKYAKHNLNKNGLIYLSNAFGTATNSARTQAEYAFGDDLCLKNLDFSDGYTYAGPTFIFMNVSLTRCANHSEMHLKADLREQYNRFVFLLDKKQTAEKNSDQTSQSKFRDVQVLEFDTTEICDHTRYVEHKWPQAGGLAIRRYQISIASAMEKVSANISANGINLVDRAINDLDRFIGTQSHTSDFHNLFFCSTLTGLGRYEKVTSWVTANYRQTKSPYWLARYAWVASQCNDQSLCSEILDYIPPKSMDKSWLPMIANLRFSIGQRDEANLIISSLSNEKHASLFLEELIVIYRTNCLLGNLSSALHYFNQVKLIIQDKYSTAGNARRASIAEMISFGIENLPESYSFFESELDELIHEFIHPLWQMNILRQFSRANEASDLGHSLESMFDHDYYVQAKLVENYLNLGDLNSAHRCAAKSELLRPGNSKHLKHLASTFFYFGIYGSARAYYSKAIIACGEDFVSRGFKAFCELPTSEKLSDVFGNARSLHLTFQSDQSFYYPFGPRPR